MNEAHIRQTVKALLSVSLGARAAPPGPQATTAEEPVKTYEFEPWDGDGMDIPLEGSDLEAFDTSMARVKAHTSAVN